MLIYIFAIALIVLLYLPFKSSQRKMKLYCITICIVLTLIAGLRNVNMGLTDTAYVYYPRLKQIANNSFIYVFTLKDYGFQVLTFIFTRIFGDNLKLYTVLFSAPYIAAVSFLIYKYSNYKWMSFLIFTCLHYYEISFTLMRQICGMALLCVALHFFIKEQYKTFIVMVILASLFHQMCIIFLVLLVFHFVKLKRWMIIPLLIILGLCLLYPQRLLGFAYTFIESDRFTRYQTLGRTKNLTLFFINALMWGAEVVVFKRIKQYPEQKLFFICSSICLAISPLTLALSEMSRVSYLFGISNVILLPEFLSKMKKGQSRMFMASVFAFVFILYFFVFLGPQVNVIPYYM